MCAPVPPAGSSRSSGNTLQRERENSRHEPWTLLSGGGDSRHERESESEREREREREREKE